MISLPAAMPPNVTPSESAPSKIVLLKRGHFSHSNPRIAEQLRRFWPAFEFEEIDVVHDLLRRHPGIVLGNLWHIFRLYWRDILRRRTTVLLAFYRTPYIFRKIRELIRSRLGAERARIAFTFQTQSLYDASVEGVPHFIYTDHTHLANLQYPSFDRRKLFAPAWIELEREIYRHATAVFVMGNHVRRSLIEQYDCRPERVHCAFAGSNVDTSDVVLDNADYTNRTILFIGIDWERKGGPSLIAAFRRVLARLPDARLIIVGCEPQVRHARIEIAGSVPRQEVKQYLLRASVFCLPSRVEPFGIAIVEAFHHRLPIVATNIGAIPDLVRDGETGRLVPPDDIEALAEALIELLTDPERCRRYGDRGAQLVSENYSWDAVGEKIRDGIHAVLAQ